MDEQVQKSCWGVTAWAVLLVGAVLAMVYVFGGADAGATAVAAIG